MLRHVSDRSRSLLATLFGRSVGPKRRRPARSKRGPIGAEQLESRAMLAGVDINGGLSWNGWTSRGLSNQPGVYGSGGMADTELYEVYTTAFAFDATSNTITDNPVQAVAPAPTGFETGRTVPTPVGPLAVSAGAFQEGNTILGIGVRATGTGSITGFKPTLRFDLDNDSYAPASATGGTVGRTSFSSFSEQGDFTVQFEGGSSWRGSTISVQAGSRTGQAATYTGTSDTVLLPGGVGSGTSYDFAFRAFAQPAAKSYQMFLDMTAIPSLYGSVYATFFPGKAGVGTIGDRVTVSLNGLGSNNVVFDANLTLPAVDLDVDSNNDGMIDPDNGPAGTDDRIEEQAPGQILFANTDDDDRNGVADALDAGPVTGENDLTQVLLAVAPTTSFGSIVVTYDESIVRLYAHPDRRGPIASGVATATGGRFYAEGRSAGTTLLTAAFTGNAGYATDTGRLTVHPYPGTIDVDIDSDNNNGFLRPARSEWEEILEDHEYGIGKLIMLDNPGRPVTPIVLEIPAGLPKNSPALGVRLDWDRFGPAGEVRLWDTLFTDAVRNPAPVDAGGNRIFPGFVYTLSALNYNATTGTITIYAEGVHETEQLKTLAGVEASPRVDERIRGTLVVNGDDAAFDEVKYLVANEDSFYYALHTRHELRNALASRGVYAFAPMPKFSLQPKSPLDLLRLGVPNDANLLLGEGSGIAGFKAMVYQDYITGEDQYVLAFAGTDDTFGQLLDWLLFGAEGDWKTNFDQGLGRGTPPQYEAAMKLGDGLSKSDGIPAGHLIVAGHSLGGGLATAAAVLGGFRADTFNAAWLRKETLLEPDGLGGTRERYPGSLVNFAGAAGTINAHYVDWDILTYFQTQFRQLDPTIAPVGLRHELDGPHDFNLTLADPIPLASLYYMSELHKNSSVLYGLLVTEDRLGHITIDLLGYVAYFSS